MDYLPDIVELIGRVMPVRVPIDERTHIFTDLGFDSLSFMALLREVEERHGVWFAITEMERCLVVGELARMTGEKLHDKIRAAQ